MSRTEPGIGSEGARAGGGAALLSCPADSGIEGVLEDPGSAASVRLHVGSCDACGRRLEELRKDRDLLREFAAARRSREGRSRQGPAPEARHPEIALDDYRIVA